MLTERKVQGHEHFHRHRLTIQQRWLIPPLLERLNRRLDQQRASRHHFHLRHSPLGVDHAVNNYVSLNSRLPRKRRIFRLNLPDQARRLHFASHAVGPLVNDGSGRRRCRRVTDSSQDAAEHAAQFLARDSSDDATCDALGAGGGGGGGATSSVFSNCGILMACVKYSGSKMSTATTTLCPKTETTKSIQVRGFCR